MDDSANTVMNKAQDPNTKFPSMDEIPERQV